MATPVQPFGSIERILMALLVRDYAPLTGLDTRIGGEMPGSVDQWYIRLAKVPGGRSDKFEGDFVVDLDVFSSDYLNAEQIAHDLEAIMLGDGYHVVITGGKRYVVDDVFENIGPADLPWAGDDDIFRIGATYALTLRRQSGVGVAAPAPDPIPEPDQGGTAYEHRQYAPSETWVVNHNLGYHPGGVRVAADNGDTYFPVVVDLDENTVRLTLSEAITGWAYIS